MLKFEPFFVLCCAGLQCGSSVLENEPFLYCLFLCFRPLSVAATSNIVSDLIRVCIRNHIS